MALITPDPIPQARALYDMLLRESGRRILLAQQECPDQSRVNEELDYLLRITGQQPAIRGMDFIHNDFAGVIGRALRWHEQGGLVSICWHTGLIGVGYPGSQQESPDILRMVTPGTAEHAQLLHRWEPAANALMTLQERGVPVLWRPFHEFDGGWFWWGKQGGEAFAALWRLMVRIFTENYGLRNLIWVLGYADDVRPGWYPGDDVCDVPGSDTYRGETTHAAAYRMLRSINPDKPLAFHEVGQLPPVQRFFEDDAVWSWVMPWHTRWLT